MRTIENLRGRPEHHRRKVAISVSFLVTVIIFAVWATAIFPGGSMQITKVDNTVEKEGKGETPLTVLRQGVAQAYQAIINLKDNTNIDLDQEYKTIRNQAESGAYKITPTTGPADR